MKQHWMIALVLVGACYVPANNPGPMYAQPAPQEVQPQEPQPQEPQPQPEYYGSDEQLNEHLTDDDDDAYITSPPPTGGSGMVSGSAGASVSIHINGQAQSYCYNHSYNGNHTGQKCFNDKASYCTSMCNESNPLSARACSNECAPPAPPMPSPNAI
jgi:hypothetical protein